MNDNNDGNMSALSAEDLRLEGNKAFSAKKWKQAVENYQESINIDGTSKDSAKVYSNLAAALCKLSKYDDAYEAAKKAPDVDPKWAKGHWRLGVVCELQKDFRSALGHYDRANELAPDERVFKLALEKMIKRTKVEKDKDGSGYTGDLPPATKSYSPARLEDGSEDAPACMVAWNRLKRRTNNLTNMNEAFPTFLVDADDMKSEWWLQYGLKYWYDAMSRQLGEQYGMGSEESMSQNINKLKLLWHRGGMTQQQYDARYTEITGCPPLNGQEFDDFLHAVTGLGGDQIPMEMGGGAFVPSPKWLSHYKPQQLVAVLQSIFNKLVHLKVRMCGVDSTQPSFWNKGEEFVLSPAVCSAANSFLGNIGQSTDVAIKEGTPEEVIKYCKKKLRQGTSWEGISDGEGNRGGGIREYVSFVYRGTVLNGFLSRLIRGLGPALRDFKWANRFITLADEEWKVSEIGDYEKYGASFRKTFQVGVLHLELGTAFFLTNNEVPRKEEALHIFNLCQTMVNIAKDHIVATHPSFESWWFCTSFGRKPLAYALSLIAQLTTTMKAKPDLLMEVIDETGMLDPSRDDNLFSYLSEASEKDQFSVNSMLAEVYKAAAITQLPDDNEQHILWWGYAAHLAQSGGYTLGELRKAIEDATSASKRVDKDLFGPSIYKGSVYPKMAAILARHFESKPDSFILPMLEKSTRPDGSGVPTLTGT